MTQLTMGQRIASRRKLLNLSQEAIAEQLGVSRQAVSKWESDAAIPEIDKLIALGRIFGVSVGWLLGTEPETAFNPKDYFTDAQMELVEEIIARHQPKPSPWKTAILAVCATAVVLGFWLSARHQMDSLAADNAAAQAQMSQLMADNQSLQTQIDEMNTLLQKQNETDKLLSYYCTASAIASEDRSGASMHFVFYPKVYQENCTAFLSIENPNADINEMLECSWQSDHYVLRTELPRADGYRYSFLLVSESGYEQQFLDEGAHMITDLDSEMNFHLAKDNPTRARLERGESAPWDIDEATYTYNLPIYTPLVYPVDKGYVPFREIAVTLRHNENVIWTRSYLDAFQAHGGTYIRSTEPLLPEITAELPALAEGDRLTLELTAESYTGLQYHTLLDDRTVTASGDETR